MSPPSTEKQQNCKERALKLNAETQRRRFQLVLLLGRGSSRRKWEKSDLTHGVLGLL